MVMLNTATTIKEEGESQVCTRPIMSLGKGQWLQKPAAGKYKVHAQGKAHSNFMTSQKNWPSPKVT